MLRRRVPWYERALLWPFDRRLTPRTSHWTLQLDIYLRRTIWVYLTLVFGGALFFLIYADRDPFLSDFAQYQDLKSFGRIFTAPPWYLSGGHAETRLWLQTHLWLQSGWPGRRSPAWTSPSPAQATPAPSGGAN